MRRYKRRRKFPFRFEDWAAAADSFAKLHCCVLGYHSSKLLPYFKTSLTHSSRANDISAPRSRHCSHRIPPRPEIMPIRRLLSDGRRRAAHLLLLLLWHRYLRLCVHWYLYVSVSVIIGVVNGAADGTARLAQDEPRDEAFGVELVGADFEAENLFCVGRAEGFCWCCSGSGCFTW
jgi:hypothetical protein